MHSNMMDISVISDLFQLISSGTADVPTRQETMKLRKIALDNIIYNKSFIKIAFDTRRIDQESVFNPRRGLQNYHRSDPFISENMSEKIKAFSKLSSILDQIKLEYGLEPEWQDSYARVLYAAVYKGLRTLQADGDYSDSQPSMASLDYLDQLIYVRYRITSSELIRMADKDLRDIILKKDELLVNGGISSSPIMPSDISKYSYDDMMAKVLTSVAHMIEEMNNKNSLDSAKTINLPKDSDGKTVTININI